MSDDDSADEIEDDFKLRSSNVRARNVVNILCAQTCTNTSNRHGTSHYSSLFSRCVGDFRTRRTLQSTYYANPRKLWYSVFTAVSLLYIASLTGRLALCEHTKTIM